jgi:hypothetical protein
LGHANRHALAWPTWSLPSFLFCPAGETHKAGSGMDEKKKKSERKRAVPLLSPNDEE